MQVVVVVLIVHKSPNICLFSLPEQLRLWMEVCSSAMGPERVLPSSEDELGEEERPGDGALLPVAAVWSGGEEAAEGEMELDGEEEEEEQEEVNSGGYYYQPLNQDPDGVNDGEQLEQDEERGEAAFHAVQQRMEVSPSTLAPNVLIDFLSVTTCTSTRVMSLHQVMGLHLPPAPPPDSDEEEDPEGAAALRSRASIPMDAGQTPCLCFICLPTVEASVKQLVFVDHVELVKRTMAAVALPSLGVPAWARDISDDQWTDMVQHTLQSRQTGGTLRLRRSNINGP